MSGKAKRVVAVTCDDSGHEALYIDGKLACQDTTIYMSDVAAYTKGSKIKLSHKVVRIPSDVDRYPESLAECLAWKVKD